MDISRFVAYGLWTHDETCHRCAPTPMCASANSPFKNRRNMLNVISDVSDISDVSMCVCVFLYINEVEKR